LLAKHASFHGRVLQYTPRASDLPPASMALSSAPPCHSMVIVPFLEEVRTVVYTEETVEKE